APPSSPRSTSYSRHAPPRFETTTNDAPPGAPPPGPPPQPTAAAQADAIATSTRRRMRRILSGTDVQTLLESILAVVLLLLVFRVSLTGRRHAIRLRGGLVALNMLCGTFAGAALAFLLRDRLRAGGPVADPLAAALIHLMPVTGAVLG